MSTEDRIELAGAIRAARHRRGWDQEQLAEAARVSRSTIQNIERGQGARQSTIDAIFEALNGTTEQAATWEPDIALTLNVLGLFLEQKSASERAEWVAKLTRFIKENA